MTSKPKPKPLLTFASLLAFLFGEVGRMLHDSRRRHLCLYTNASEPPSCVHTGRSICNGKG